MQRRVERKHLHQLWKVLRQRKCHIIMVQILSIKLLQTAHIASLVCAQNLRLYSPVVFPPQCSLCPLSISFVNLVASLLSSSVRCSRFLPSSEGYERNVACLTRMGQRVKRLEWKGACWTKMDQRMQLKFTCCDKYGLECGLDTSDYLLDEDDTDKETNLVVVKW